MKELSAKERRFVSEYLKDENGSAAAIRAGYASKSARITASRLLTKENIKAAVSAKLDKIEEIAIVDRAYVLKNLKRVFEKSMSDARVMEFDHEEKTMVHKHVEVLDEATGKTKWVGVYEFDSGGANRSLELLGKTMKMFTDKIEVKADEGIYEQLARARKRARERRTA